MEDVALVQCCHVEQEASSSKGLLMSISVQVTTAQARLMLNNLAGHQLQRRVLYCDTDRIIVVSIVGDSVRPLGPFLEQH